MHHSIIINNEELPIVIRKHSASRRITIRYQPLKHHLSLIIPRYVSIKQGLRFVEEKRRWIEHEMQTHHKHIPFTDGQTIPLFGKEYILRHTGGRGVIAINDGYITVPGEEAFMARRVREWIKRRAKEEIVTLAKAKAQYINRPIKKISVRDTSSRWGSCSHDGSLSFSWRLAFAPYEVLEYLVSHEVAHIKEHNHSPAFWAIVRELCPHYKQANHWLKRHGAILYAYG